MSNVSHRNNAFSAVASLLASMWRADAEGNPVVIAPPTDAGDYVLSFTPGSGALPTWELAADAIASAGTAELLDVTSSPYLADKTGVSDCRAAVASAIAAVKASATLGGIFFPAGNYKFTRAAGPGVQGLIDITGTDGFVVAGCGPKSRLFHDAPSQYDTHFFRVYNNVDRFVIRDIVVDGSYTGATNFPNVSQQNHLLKLGEGTNTSTNTHSVVVQRVFLKNCRGDAINLIGATNARGELTFTGQPANNETVTLGTKTYTFKTTLTGAADEVLIGASTNASIDNLVSAVDASAGEGTTYGTGTTANADADGSRDGSVFVARGTTAGPTVSTDTIANASWGAATLPYIDALIDEVSILDSFIYQTYRACIGVQRGARRTIISRNHLKNTTRGVIDFEPTGNAVNTEDYRHGNSPQQFIITNNIMEQSNRGGVVATLFGIGASDRNKYSVFSGNVLLGGGVNALNSGPVIMDGNLVIGSRNSNGKSDPLVQFWRGAQDIIIANNVIERPVPDDGDNTSAVLEFHPADDDGIDPTQPLNNETATIGTKTYRFVTVLSAANDVFIGATLAATCANLVAAILDNGDEGVQYGTGTTANSAITSATTDGETVTVLGTATTTVSDTLSAGFWSGSSLLGSAGTLIEIQENNGTQPTRVTIANNILRQYMPKTCINLVAPTHTTVVNNQIHAFHSAVDTGNGITVDCATADADQVHIRGNTIIDQGTGNLVYGIRFDNAGAALGHSSAVDNVIKGTKHGISYDGTPDQAPTVHGNRVSDISGTPYVLPTPTHIGGQHGGGNAPGTYQGAGAPSFSAAKFSVYYRTDGTAGAGGTAGTARYMNTDGASTWAALIDG